MKSNASAGFKSKPPTNEPTIKPTVLDSKKEKSEEENFKEMEE